MKTRLLFAAPLAALALIGALVLLIRPAEALGTAPMVRTENVQNVLMASHTITATPVPAALLSSPVRVDGYTSADVFVTTEFSGTGELSAWVTFAADSDNYAYAYHDILSTAGEYTGTYTTDVERIYYEFVTTDDGTLYLSFPVRGQNMRLEFEASGLAGTENVAVTARAVLKN